MDSSVQASACVLEQQASTGLYLLISAALKGLNSLPNIH